MGKIRVLIVDDSALVRKMLTEFLAADPGIEVVGTAPDPLIAREKIKQLNPDVLTLDVEMPRMDGVTFLRNLMRLRPMPVVMVSSLTEKGADITLEALSLGAIDFVTKPKADLGGAFGDYAAEVVAKVKAASRARPQALEAMPARSAVANSGLAGTRLTHGLFAIGASTGGTEAIIRVLGGLPSDSPGVVLAQHIPAAFSMPFAKRISDNSALVVREAEDGEQVLPGHGYLPPGGLHLEVARSGARFVCRVSDADPVNRHRPSVDVLFRSLAECAGENVCAALLTGMGADGAAGLLQIREAGGRTLAQDEDTSVVWGMPGSAVKMDAADKVVPLQDVAQEFLRFAKERAAD